ncbi:MAG TPA: ANTAR domain-containing protein [Mycobacteriales bacterium]|nr:ANTAR domain-containing protein [Mycobacteriales bacterium]
MARIGDELSGLRRAMASRSVIDQAKGAVRAVTGLSGDEAFALLAARSQNANRKLSDVAADVLASTHPDSPGTTVFGALQLPDTRGEPPTTPTGWRSRRRVDHLLAAVTDDAHLRALAGLGSMLAAAASRAEVVDVLLRDGAESLGAFGAVVATLTGTGAATVETAGGALVYGEPRPVSLAVEHPLTAVLRSRAALVLSRADLALRYPEHPRPERLAAVAVLPAATDSADPVAWSLYFDHALPPDRSLRALLDCAARLATGALTRAG